jgi:IclR family transcriptional regulator, pca regulon regulatory protein
MPIPALCARPGGVTIETAMAKPGAQQTGSRPDDRSAGRRDTSRRGRTARLAPGPPSRAPKESGPGGAKDSPARSRPAGPEDEPAPSVPTLKEPRYSQSLERGLAILECFTPQRPERGIADLADELGMSRSTTHRYALTMTELGYLARAKRRRYRLALRVTRLGMSALAGTDLTVLARPYLEELSRRTSYTVGIAVLDGPEIVCVDRVRGARRTPGNTDLGIAAAARLPAHCTATGKLLLACLPPEALRAVMGELELSRRGPNTITGKRALAKALEEIREEGIATSDEETAPGLVEIAASVRIESGEVVVAVGMEAHTSMIDLDSLLEHLGPHLVSTADLVSAYLGYRRQDESHGPGRYGAMREPRR